MSYERDRDRVTRGVGAIAALDHVSPQRQAARLQVGRATRQRDRSMAAVTAGALGRIGMGIDRTTGRPVPGTRTTGRAAVVDHRTNKPPPPTNLPPAAPPPGGGTPKTPGVYTAPPTKTPYPGMPRPPAATVPAAPVPVPTPTPTPTPTPVPVPTAPAPTTGTTSGGSSGGGGGGSGGGRISTTAVPPLPPAETLPDVSITSDNTTTILIASAVGIAALLWFTRSTS